MMIHNEEDEWMNDVVRINNLQHTLHYIVVPKH